MSGVKISGKGNAIAKMLAMAGPETIAEIGTALFKAGEVVQVDAQNSLTTGAASFGRHIPSLPGQPPNQDTGFLGNNIETTQPAALRVLVASNAPYSADLEFGTSKMAARPFMRPAAEKNRAEVQAFMKKAIQKAARKAVKK